MKIEVDDELFEELAQKLDTTPEKIINILLDRAQNLPYTVILKAIQKNSSLYSALEELMKFAEPAYVMGSLIEKIVGDYDCEISDGGYNFDEGTFWFDIEFFQGDKNELDSAHIQFGNTAVTLVTFSIKDLVSDTQSDKYLEEIESIVESNIDEEYELVPVTIEKNEMNFTLSIFSEEFFDIPKISEMEKIVKEIKIALKKHDQREKLN